jgi:hypothetical protein
VLLLLTAVMVNGSDGNGVFVVGVNDGNRMVVAEDPQFAGGRQTALKLALALANTTESCTRVNLLT